MFEPEYDFCSNDYLGMSRRPEVLEAALRATSDYGSGSRSSRVVSGNLPVHEELETELAQWKGTEACLLFSSGYLAGAGVVQALAQAFTPALPVVFDKLIHASLLDAARVYGKKFHSFRHNDSNHLEEILKRISAAESRGNGAIRSLVIVEGVYGMDGDMAPLAEIAKLCSDHGALLLVDDAHGTGTVGRGSCTLAGIEKYPNVIQLGTLSKALGTQGGFIAGEKWLVDFLLNFARPLIYDTALAPGCAAAALSAVKLIRNNPALQSRLEENAALLREAVGVPALPIQTPIVPVILEDADIAVQAAAKLTEHGIGARAIRPPTVPKGTSRLRLSVNVAQTDLARDIVQKVLRSLQITNKSA